MMVWNNKEPFELSEKDKRYCKIIDIMSLIVLVSLFIYIIYSWSSIPDIIPTHFNFKGEIDGYGNKIQILLLPSIAVFVYITFAFCEKLPKEQWNTGIKVTEENKQAVYSECCKMVAWEKFFSILIMCIINIYIVKSIMLPPYILVLILLLLFIPLIIYYFRIRKLKEF